MLWEYSKLEIFLYLQEPNSFTKAVLWWWCGASTTQLGLGVKTVRADQWQPVCLLHSHSKRDKDGTQSKRQEMPLEGALVALIWFCMEYWWLPSHAGKGSIIGNLMPWRTNKNQEIPLKGGFGCLELVSYGKSPRLWVGNSGDKIGPLRNLYLLLLSTDKFLPYGNYEIYCQPPEHILAEVTALSRVMTIDLVNEAVNVSSTVLDLTMIHPYLGPWMDDGGLLFLQRHFIVDHLFSWYIVLFDDQF